eukprot:s699_g19.t1
MAGTALRSDTFLEALAVTAQDKILSSSAQDLSNRAWTAATSSHCDLPLLHVIKMQSVSRRHEPAPQNASNLLWAFATLGTTNEICSVQPVFLDLRPSTSLTSPEITQPYEPEASRPLRASPRRPPDEFSTSATWIVLSQPGRWLRLWCGTVHFCMRQLCVVPDSCSSLMHRICATLRKAQRRQVTRTLPCYTQLRNKLCRRSCSLLPKSQPTRGGVSWTQAR